MKGQLWDYENVEIVPSYDHEFFLFGGPKTREEAWGAVIAEFRMTPSLALVAEAYLREVVSTDLRIQYDRSRYALSVRWQP